MSCIDERTGLPPAVLAWLTDHLGGRPDLARLSGVKQNGGCLRAVVGERSVIVKGAERREWAFFECADALPAGLRPHLPVCFAAWQTEDGCWVAMEDVPRPLPRERWLADRAALAVLAVLHSVTWGQPAAVEEPFRPRWSDEMTETVLTLFGPDAPAVEGPLRRAQAAAQPLFAPRCWVQGDANPTNWRLRADGTAVLVDWERVGLATPAIDLAVTVPGVGSVDGTDERRVAEGYEECWRATGTPLPAELAGLERQVVLAKRWNVVEFLAESGSALPPDRLEGLLTGFRQALLGVAL